MLVLEKGGKTRGSEEKNLGARTRTNNKLNPHMVHQVWESNLGHNGGRQVLSPLCHPTPPSSNSE